MNDKKILQDAIRETGLLAQAKIVWLMHPILEDIAVKFAGYVGPHSVTQSGKSLLQHSLKDAFAQYATLEKENDAEGATRQFARCLLSHSIEVFAQELVVETPGGDKLWMPFVCTATAFMKEFPADAKVSCTWVKSRISWNIATGFMMPHLLPTTMLDQDTLAELLGEAKEVS